MILGDAMDATLFTDAGLRVFCSTNRREEITGKQAYPRLSNTHLLQNFLRLSARRTVQCW